MDCILLQAHLSGPHRVAFLGCIASAFASSALSAPSVSVPCAGVQRFRRRSPLSSPRLPPSRSRACPVRACGRRRPDRSTRAPAGWRRQLRQKVGEAAPPRGAARRPCTPPTTTPRPAKVMPRDLLRVCLLRFRFCNAVVGGCWSPHVRRFAN